MTVALAALALACTPQTNGTWVVEDCTPHVAVIVCDHECRRRERWRRVVRPQRSYLEQIAWCESRGRWHIATGNGYYGGLQFTLRSWWAVGGRGYPHLASKLEQMFRAIRLARVQGWGAWPVCRWA